MELIDSSEQSNLSCANIINKELKPMIAFIIGLLFGAIFGVVAMCLVQINHDERNDE